jgi:WD40 repeat protein
MTRIGLLTLAMCAPCSALSAAPIPPTTPAHRPEPEFAPESEIDVCQPLLRLGDARLRHTAPVGSLALTADGRFLLTTTRTEPVLKLWDVKTGRLLRTVRSTEGLTEWMTVFALTPDARRAVVVRHQWHKSNPRNRWHEPALIDLSTGAVQRWPRGNFNGDHVLALSPDGQMLAGLIDGNVRVWEFASGTERVLGTIPDLNSPIRDICFSPDGARVAACRGRDTFYIAPVRGGDALQRVRVKCGNDDVLAVYWPQPDRMVAVWSSRMAALDPATGAQRDQSPAFEAPIGALTPKSAGGERLFIKIYGSDRLATFDLATLRLLPEFASRCARDGLVAVSGNGAVLAVASGHAVRLFDTASGAPLHPDLERAPFEPVTRLYTAANTLLGATEATAHTWDRLDGTALATFEGESWLMNRFVLSPDGRFAVGGVWNNRRPLVADVRTGRVIPVRNDGSGGTTDEAVGFAGANRVWVWNRNRFRVVGLGTDHTGRAVPGFAGAKYAVASPDGRKLAASGRDGLALCDLDTDRGWVVLDTYKGRRKRPPGGPVRPPYGVPARFSPCGRWLLVADVGLELWHVQNEPVLTGRFECAGALICGDGDFSPDGRFLAAAVEAPDGASELCVWETASGGEVYRFRPSRGVTGCAFSPNGRCLIIAHSDTTLSIWDRAGVEARQCGAVPVGEEWNGLGSRDAKHAHAAVAALVADPKRALAVLAPALAPPDEVTTNRLFVELGSEEFRVRERAQRALAALGARAEVKLLEAVTKSASAEIRVRAAALLSALGPPGARLGGERLCTSRAVGVLERIASPEAQALLATWATTYPNTPLAAEANSALARLRKK